MQQHDATFAGPRGMDIHSRHWLPDDPPAGGVLLVHGLAEHCGRYDGLVHRLLALGLAVFALDHPGHGLSAGARGHVTRFSDYLETLEMVWGRVQAEHPDLPLFLYGHSMGGLISLHFMARHPEGLKGAVLSAPPVTVPRHVPRAVVALGRLMSSLFPRLPLIGLDAEGMSRDLDVVAAYQDDPLVFTGKITARLGAELSAAIEQAPTVAAQVRLPVLVLQGGSDPVVDPDGAPQLMSWLAGSDTTLRTFPGLYHELHHEPEKDQVLSDVSEWLRSHL